MKDRRMVIEQVRCAMKQAFVKGDFADAQNMNSFIASLEGLSDEDYSTLVTEEPDGAIA